MFRRTCVSGRLSVARRKGWRPKPETVPQPCLGAFSASLAAFSELVNASARLAARVRQSSTTAEVWLHQSPSERDTLGAARMTERKRNRVVQPVLFGIDTLHEIRQVVDGPL